MTVSKMIELLQQKPPDMRVALNSEVMGYTEVHFVEEEEVIRFNTPSPRIGEYQDGYDGEDQKKEEIFTICVIS